MPGITPQAHTMNDTASIQRADLNSPMKVSIDEIRQQIDQQIQSIDRESEDLPSVLASYFVPGARDRRRAMEVLMQKKTDASIQMVDGLMSMIGVYLKAHESDLRVRKAAFIEETFQGLSHQLRVSAEGRYRIVFETLAASLAAYEGMVALPEDIRQFAVDEAKDRAKQAIKDGSRSLLEGFQDMERLVRRLKDE